MNKNCQCNTNYQQNQISTPVVNISREKKMGKGCCLSNGIDKVNQSNKLIMKQTPSSYLVGSPHISSSVVQSKSKTWLQILHNKGSPEVPQNGSPETQILMFNPSFNPQQGGELDSFIGSEGESKKMKNRAMILVDIFHSEIKELDDRNFLRVLMDCKNVIDIRNGIHKSFSSTKEYRKKINDEQLPKKQLQQRTSSSTHSPRSRHGDAPGQLTTSGIMMKGFSNLIKNFEIVNKQAEDQRTLLENLTLLVSQLKEENKMLHKMRDTSIEMESKLIKLSSENRELKEKLGETERAYEENKLLLNKREKDIENLTCNLKFLKSRVAGKIGVGIRYLEDPTIELTHLNETIASLPDHQENFNILIRPASSSPTHEINSGKKVELNEPHVYEQANVSVKSKNLSKNEDDQEKGFHKLRENVKRLTEVLEADMNKNNAYLNLSDVTFPSL